MRSEWLALTMAMGCLPTQASDVGAISARAGEWTWVEFAESLCGNGQPTGLGVNPAASADADVLIFLAGGGACWDAATCHLTKSAWNVELGYSAASFSADGARALPLFDRQKADNPFRDLHFAWLPYCTGDLHLGSTTQPYLPSQPMHHAGARNLEAFLARLGPTYAKARTVYVVGVSAGGYGATMNAHRFRAAFPAAEVHVLADSSALVAPSTARWAAWTDAWKPASPPSCLDCAVTPGAWVTAARTALGSGRLALITSDGDALLTSFTERTDVEFRAGVSALVDAEYRTPRSAAFVVPGSRHVFLNDWNTSVNGVSLASWLDAFRRGEGFTTP